MLRVCSTVPSIRGISKDELELKLKETGGLKYHKVEDIENILSRLEFSYGYKKNVQYLDIPISFDIETSSCKSTNSRKEETKFALMYEWNLCIAGIFIMGRTWEEFIFMLDKIREVLGLNQLRRIIIYVHNLGFEFQFMRKHIEWERVFALKEREPVKALSNGIEFRCSLLLSGYSLAKLSDQLTVYKVGKLVGELDYRKVRTSDTPLTFMEIQYCLFDTFVVVCYIEELIERHKHLSRLPLTKTGFVRIFFRNKCLYTEGSHKNNTEKYIKYRKLMDELTLTPDSYSVARKAFAGGFVHANALFAGKTIKNVKSFDFTSAYPAVMVCEKFPMSKPRKVYLSRPQEVDEYCKTYACMFRIELYDVEETEIYENYISVSHCYNLEECIQNNGRVVSAKHLSTYITEQDWFIIRRFYKWRECRISDFYIMRKEYLPRDFIMGVLEEYKIKTELKGVEGKEVEYLVSKENINSAYGMTVTDVLRKEIVYNEEWEKEEPDVEKAISKYNNDRKRFLFYLWGVWVTAYNRFNLFTAISEFGYDYVYSDTDSVKVVNYDEHMKYIENYNNIVQLKLKKVCGYYNIPLEMTRPKTIKGVEKILGAWDDEGIYTRFKTLGAKRYMTEKNGEISITVSGLNKDKAVPWLLKEYGNNIFEKFTDGLSVPPEHTGKLTHTYIDEDVSGTVTDYLGNKYDFDELSSVHLEPAPYEASIASKYADYLMNVQERVAGW